MADNHTMGKLENSLLARFESHALGYGRQTAIVDGRRRLDYGQLHLIADKLARRFLEIGSAAGGVVAVLVQDEIDMCVGLICAQKAGKTFIPLNPSFPETRLTTILDMLEQVTILVDETTIDLASRIADEKSKFIRIDNLEQVNTQAYPEPVYDPQALSWIIFTSGSTGQPKGVMQTYRNANLFARQAIRSLELKHNDRLATSSSLTSHAGVVFTLGVLSGGATLCLMEPKKRSTAELARWLTEESVTILGTVPTLFRRLAEEHPEHNNFPSLRQLRLSGETVTGRDVALFNRCCPADCTLAVGYGTTETGGISQAFFTQESTFSDGRISVGFAHKEVEIHLYDESNEKVSIDEPGEIVVTSTSISPGYWNRPDLTRPVFSRSPDGRRRYRTGDIGMLRKDGALEHLGRKDSQVQISGQRVEITEIEMALQAVSYIKEAVVQSFPDANGQLRLVAYVVIEQTGNSRHIRDALAQTLPMHMIPSKIIRLDRLPLTGNGKVDRQALPGPGSDAYEHRELYVPAESPLERAIVSIWEEVLGKKPIGATDDFFNIGGDSINATLIVSRLCNLFDIDIPLSTMFEAPTIAQLAEQIQQPKRGLQKRITVTI